MTIPAMADPLRDLQKRLPVEVNGWKAVSGDRFFDEKSIFSYINGAAEVYRAYNMKQCFTRRYQTEKGPSIILDLFDMGSSKDAFGVFTHDTDGKPVAIGQDGRYRPGWLSFWKNRYFISIYMEEESDDAEKAVLDLGRRITSLIQESGSRPGILHALPQEGLNSNSIRYLHHPIVLNYHFYIADDNILNISPQTDAVLATYLRSGQEILILIVEYPDVKQAGNALKEFFTHYLPDADPAGAARLEDGTWSAAIQKDRRLAIVLEAGTRESANQLLTSFK